MPDNELIARPQSELEADASKRLMGLLKKYERSFSSVLPKEFTPGRWQWLIVNSIRKTPALCGCTPTSFINSVMLAANLQVEIRDRSAYLIPFGSECQLLLDYRAKIDLASRAGWIIKPDLVRETDEFRYTAGDSGIMFLHSPNYLKKVDGKFVAVGEDRGEVVLTYAFCQHDREKQIEIMSVSDIEKIRKRSRNPGVETTWVDRRPQKRILTLDEIRSLDFGAMSMKDSRKCAWSQDWDRMALKTVVHRCFNGLPCTPEMATSQEIDKGNEAEGTSQPIAPQLAEVLYEIDPADDRPMLEAGTQEEHDELKMRLDLAAKLKLEEMEEARRK
jgi:phage RecT family recombinase